MALWKLLAISLAFLLTRREYAAKHISKEEWDARNAQFQRDLQACKGDNVCKRRVKDEFLPVLDLAVESGLEEEQSCGVGGGGGGGGSHSALTGRQDADVQTCGAPEPKEPKINRYKKMFLF